MDSILNKGSNCTICLIECLDVNTSDNSNVVVKITECFGKDVSS